MPGVMRGMYPVPYNVFEIADYAARYYTCCVAGQEGGAAGAHGPELDRCGRSVDTRRQEFEDARVKAMDGSTMARVTGVALAAVFCLQGCSGS